MSSPPKFERAAIVTGAVGDLGRSIAIRLASDGFTLALNDLPEQITPLNELVADIQSKGGKAIAIPADVSVEGDVEGMIASTVEQFGSLDVMVSNVGIFKGLLIDQMDINVWDKILAVNTRGMMLCYKWAAKQMIKQGKGGKLIGGCSGAGLTGAPLCSAYCASKFAVRGLTQCAAMEYGRFGITANTYAPGFIGDTKMWSDFQDVAESTMNIPKGGFAAHMTSNVIKLGKVGKPDDIAGLVSFLASKDSEYITGQLFSCDGGMHIA